MVGVEKELSGGANDGEKEASLLEVDDAGGSGLGKLVERRGDGVHVVQRRQAQREALIARAVLRHTHQPGAMAEVIDAIVLIFHGGGVAGASGVVDVFASSVCDAQ